VGVNRTQRLTSGGSLGIPHACGGEPNRAVVPLPVQVYSPRMWG